MNSYNIEEKGCVFYHAIAENEQQVAELALEAGYDLTGMNIELERTDVCDQLNRPCRAQIVNALIY